jgi:hypothetical protein
MASLISGLLYLTIGVLVAAHYGYLSNVTTLNNVISGMLAIAFWPLIFLGINLHVTI